MSLPNRTTITVEALINTPLSKVWQYWIDPQHIIKWNNASDDWHTPRAENDLKTGGSFNYRMEAKDGSWGFDFEGKYDEVKPNEAIAYTIADGRKVRVDFCAKDKQTKIIEIFEAETIHSVYMQRDGWQAILNNFKKYVEND